MSGFGRSARVAGFFAVALVSTGCTPAIQGIIGIERAGDSFRIVAATCGGFTLHDADLLDLSQTNQGSEYVAVRDWPMQSGPGPGAITELFAADDFIRFVGQGRFRLSGSFDAIWPSVAIGPDLTSASLSRLGDGEVLTVDAEHSDEFVLSDVDEMSGAADSLVCG